MWAEIVMWSEAGIKSFASGTVLGTIERILYFWEKFQN